MKTPYLMVMAAAACTTATVSQTTPSPAAQARADGGRPPYTAADVRFMAGMIGHHAQAVPMAGWAPPHGAGPAGFVPCEGQARGPKATTAVRLRPFAQRTPA